MLDADLATLYGVTTKRLNQQFRRNHHRFPDDFAFQLTLSEAKEVGSLRLQNATLKRGQHIKHPPHVFTEHGAIMLASVLNSMTAIKASMAVVDAFIRLRELLGTHKDLARKLKAMEMKYDSQFRSVFAAIRELMKPSPEAPMPRVKGFRG